MLVLLFMGLTLIVGGISIQLATASQTSATQLADASKLDNGAEAGMNIARATLWNASDPTDPGAVADGSTLIDELTVKYSGAYDDTSNVCPHH